MNKSWTNGESWKRPQPSNDLTSLITRSIATTMRAGPPVPPVVAAGPFWQPLSTTPPVDETWRPPPVVGESWRSGEPVSKSETWRQRDRQDRRRLAAKEQSKKESDLRHAKDRERSRSPPTKRRRDQNGRKPSRWEPLPRKSEKNSHKSSPDPRTAKVKVPEESADDAADKLGPTYHSTVDDAWEARLNAALQRDVECSPRPESASTYIARNPKEDVFSFPDVQMPEDLIEIDPGQKVIDDEQPSRSVPGLKFRGERRLIIRAFKIAKNDVRRFYSNDAFKSILANPPILALSRLTPEEMHQWKAEFPPSLPVFRKRRQRTSAQCVARSVMAAKQRQVRRLKESAEKRSQIKERSLDINDCFDDDGTGGNDRLLDGDEDEVKVSKDDHQEAARHRRLLRRPPPGELPPGLDFLAAATQPLPSFKIKKKVPVKDEAIEDKWKKSSGGAGNRRKPASEQPKVAKPVEGSVVDRARDKKLVDGFFDRNLGHYRQAVRPRVKTPTAKKDDMGGQKKETGWSSKENVEKVSDWLSSKPPPDRGPATPPGSGPDDSPAVAHVDHDDNPSPAAAAVVQESPMKPLFKDKPLLAPDINPLDYVEELSNPGDNRDAIERQQFTKEEIAGPSSNFVWTGTDEDHDEVYAATPAKVPHLGEALPIHHQTAHPSQHFHSATRSPMLPSPVNSSSALFPYVQGRQPLIPNGLLPTPDLATPVSTMTYRSGSVEPRPRSSSSGVRSGSPMDVEDDSESRSRSPQMVGRQALLGDRPRALLAVPPESPALLSTPSTPMTLPRPPKQPLIPTPSSVPAPESMVHHWRPKAPLLTEIVPERPRLNGPATKFVRPTTTTGSPTDATSFSQSPLATTSVSAGDDDGPTYTVDQLRTILNILLKDPSSSLQNQHDRRLKAEQLLAILDEVEAMQLSQSMPLTQGMLQPIVQFVLDSSGLLK